MDELVHTLFLLEYTSTKWFLGLQLTLHDIQPQWWREQ